MKQRDEDMVHTSWRHGEKVNYNGPKVAQLQLQDWSVAPSESDLA